MDQLGVIHVLLLEDVPEDAQLCELELRKAGLEFVSRRADCADTFLRELREFQPDLILADNSLPGFGGLRALEMARVQTPETPFIFVSGSVGEEQAIEIVRSGATDYVLKHRLSRLVPAVRRALDEAGERRRRRQAEEALRQSEERYALAVQGTNDGIWDWDLAAGQIYYSPRWKAMLGFEPGEIGTTPDEWFRRVHPDDLHRLKSEIAAHIDGGLLANFEIEHRMAHKTGGYSWVVACGLVVRGAGGQAVRIVGSQSDINRRKSDEAQLRHNAFHDHLTGLPNRALFLDRLGQAIRRARRLAHAHFAVLFLDLDRFKLVNDSFGHSMGDQLIKVVATRIAECLRQGDTVARMGGDEFAVLLENCGEPTARRIADRINRALRAPADLGTQQVYAPASIGIMLGTGDEERAEDLLRDADTAMYKAKSRGRDRVELFTSSMRDEALRTQSIDAELRRALERQELELQYQPIVALEREEIVGFEALLRWHHPTRGLLQAAEFIPVAEETGVVFALDRWVVTQVCRQLQQWRATHVAEAAKLFVSVNLSGQEFMGTDIQKHVAAAVREAKLAGGGLILELTEGALMAEGGSAVEVLSALRKQGVHCYLDDFGTGYSSLAYLHRLPIDALKIDQSFVRGLDGDGESREIVKTIAALGRNLGKMVIAEGVETAAHWIGLRAMGCTHGQGFYFSPPVAGDGAMALMTRGNGGGLHPPGVREAC